MIAFFLTAFGFLRNSWIGKVLAWGAGALMVAVLIFTAGGRTQKKKQKIKNLEEYIDLRERTDKTADQTLRDLDGISRSDLTSRLRKHGAIRD